MSKTYYSAVAGFVNNVHREVGEPIGTLSDDEAKYLLMAGQITHEALAAEKPRRSRTEMKGEPAAAAPEKVQE